MIKHYTLENKPNFKYGEFVVVDMNKLANGLGILQGKIVGKSSEHIIDMWLVEFDQTFPSYPYKVIAVMHTAIVESLPINSLISTLKPKE